MPMRSAYKAGGSTTLGVTFSDEWRAAADPGKLCTLLISHTNLDLLNHIISSVLTIDILTHS